MPVFDTSVWIPLISFTLWMFFDAIRRQAGWFWYVVILAAPLGPFIYFFTVKLPNVTTKSESNPVKPTSPVGPNTTGGGLGVTLLADLNQADRLELASMYDDAVPIYQHALSRNPSDLRALHGMARCELGMGHPREAANLLERILSKDREYGDFGAALDYADALWLSGQREDTVELLRGLARLTGRINHRLAYAHYLAENGELSIALTEVQGAIDDHAALPENQKAPLQHWRDRATKMLDQLRET